MKLKEIAEIRTGLVLSRKKGDIHDWLHHSYQVVSLKAFSQTGKLLLDALDVFVAHGAVDDEYLTHEGDVLVRLREPNIAIHIDSDSSGLVVPSHVAIIRSKYSGLMNEYLAHYINAHSVQRGMRKALKGTTIPMIKINDLADLEIALPSVDEQRRISAWIDLANKEIALLENLKTAKNHYKNDILDTIIQQGSEA